MVRIIEEYKLLTTSNGYFSKKRIAQLKDWLHQSIADKLKETFYNNPSVKAELTKMEAQLSIGNINPYRLASELISKWKS